VTELSVLERVRAAVAEAGYDPSDVVAPFDPDASFAFKKATIPREVAWRAREAVLIGDPACFCCTEAAMSKRWIEGCLAVRRFVEDCGRDRTEP
jgi:hypothetical protein